MRLADFISGNSEAILKEWVDFAATCGPAGATMDADALRDHAADMLRTIVEDLRTPQTDAEQSAKSKGMAPETASDEETAAEVHGAGRAQSGFTIAEMVSEYRALRASVLRLWTKANGTLAGPDIEDLMRFNETIDQALAESTDRFADDLSRSREIFLGILGHDLRTPLGAVITATQFMLDSGELAEPNLTLATTTLRSTRRMEAMVSDLLDFTRGRLGAGIPITRADTDLAPIVRHVVDEVNVSSRSGEVTFTTTGDTHGSWDAGRLGQVVSNLVGNALQHGLTQSPVTVVLRGEDSQVVMSVQNFGPTIPAADLHGVFAPFKQVGSTDGGRGTGSLGLGLFIAEQIVVAHGGQISAQSSAASGTTFTVVIPRAETGPGLVAGLGPKAALG